MDNAQCTMDNGQCRIESAELVNALRCCAGEEKCRSCVYFQRHTSECLHAMMNDAADRIEELEKKTAELEKTVRLVAVCPADVCNYCRHIPAEFVCAEQNYNCICCTHFECLCRDCQKMEHFEWEEKNK